MSLFRRERIFASIEFDRLALVRLSADGEAHDEIVIPVDLHAVEPGKAIEPVQSALEARAWRGCPRHVVLSDRLVRYVVSERPAGARSAAEVRRVCEARFQQSLGRPIGEWELATDARPFARHDLVCGIERSLLATLTATFATAGRLASIRPFLVCELKRVARRLPSHCWFAAAVRDGVALAGIVEGECRVVRLLALDQPSAPVLKEAIVRESLLSGAVPADAAIIVTGIVSGDPAPAMLERIDAPHWRSRPSTWSTIFRVALAERWT